MVGYSNTPLIRKLGIKDGFRFALVNAPEGFAHDLGPVPLTAIEVGKSAKEVDFILVFSKSEQSLRKTFQKLATRLKPNGMIWVSWPKKSSGLVTDLSFGNVQRIGLDAGLVDVKICAVNEIWSGLKFVYRLQDRASPRSQ